MAVYAEKGICGEAVVVRECEVEWKLVVGFCCKGLGVWGVGRCGVCTICCRGVCGIACCW